LPLRARNWKVITDQINKKAREAAIAEAIEVQTGFQEVCGI
jgi:hypothetical protein